MLRNFLSIIILFLGVFACGSAKPFDREKITASKTLGDDDAKGKPAPEPDPETPEPVNPVGNGEDADVGPGDSVVCQAGMSLTRKATMNYELKASAQNPLNLQPTDNYSYNKYWQDFSRLAKEGFSAYNDAASYGVSIVSPELLPGTLYWRAIGVHHLLPYENRSNHNAFVEVLDQTGKQIRDNSLYAKVYKAAEDQTGMQLRLDKPLNEPAGNYPMYKGDHAQIEVEQSGGFVNLPTERVIGMGTVHPDEPLPDGNFNTIGHHSFYSVFQLTKKPFRQVKLLLDHSVSISIDTLEVKSGSGTVIKGSETVGALVFDGLAEENYTLTVGATSYPVTFAKDEQSLELNLKAGDCP